MKLPPPEKIKPSDADVLANVRAALAEDVGSGDITAALIPSGAQASARVITREDGVLCGSAWVGRVFAELDPSITLTWQTADGEPIVAGQQLFSASGSARGLLTGERTALNFLQLLSGTATDGRYLLKKWPQTEREYPKHFRIATVMMKGPAGVTEIAEASGVGSDEVADFINANLATGYAEVAVDLTPPEPPSPRTTGLFGRIRGH